VALDLKRAGHLGLRRVRGRVDKTGPPAWSADARVDSR